MGDVRGRRRGHPHAPPNFPVFGPDGSLYVSESGNWDVADGVIYRFPPGSSSGEVFHAGPFHYTNGLAIDALGEYLYVVETALHSVSRLRIAGGRGAVPEPLCPRGSLEWMPDGLALDAAGALYVTMYSSDRIYRIEPGGEPRSSSRTSWVLALNRPTNSRLRRTELRPPLRGEPGRPPAVRRRCRAPRSAALWRPGRPLTASGELGKALRRQQLVLGVRDVIAVVPFAKGRQDVRPAASSVWIRVTCSAALASRASRASRIARWAFQAARSSRPSAA